MSDERSGNETLPAVPDDSGVELEVVDPFLGRLLQGRVEIRRRLGIGGMGVVYEGFHQLIRKRVAIKVLHAQFAADAEAVKRFRREAEAAAGLDHPNIVQVTDMGVDQGSIFIVLEFLEGASLATVLEARGQMSIARTVHILAQLCDALIVAHDAGIVHRDLKPDNVFLITRNGDASFVKLLDFGIAKVTGGPGATKLTKTGAGMGTPYYMAPEQVSAKDVDRRADIFSLGVMMYEMLGGQLPFLADSYPALLLKVCMEEAPPLATLRPDLPEAIVAIIDRMMKKDREERFPDCASVKAAWLPFAMLDEGPPVAQRDTRRLGGVDVGAPTEHALVATPPSTDGVARPALAANTPSPPLDATRLDTPASAPSVASPQSSAPSQPRSAPTPRLHTDPSPRRMGLYAALGSGLVATVIAVAIVASFGAEDRSNETVAPSTRSTESRGAPQAALPIEVPNTPDERRVHLSIAVRPPNAALTLDGEPIDNPFEADVVGTDTARERSLEARLPGYATLRRSFVPNETHTIDLELRERGGQRRGPDTSAGEVSPMDTTVEMTTMDTAAETTTMTSDGTPPANGNPSEMSIHRGLFH